MVSEDFFINFFTSLLEQITHRCGGANLNPRVIDCKGSAGRPLLHVLNIEAIGFMVSEDF